MKENKSNNKISETQTQTALHQGLTVPLTNIKLLSIIYTSHLNTADFIVCICLSYNIKIHKLFSEKLMKKFKVAPISHG